MVVGMADESENPIQRISHGNRTYEFSFKVELESPEEQMEMEVNDPQALARRTSKSIIMDGDTFIGLADVKLKKNDEDGDETLSYQ